MGGITPARLALGAAPSLAWLALVAAGAAVVRRRWPGRAEWSRKLVHIGCGPVVPIAAASQLDRGLALGAAGSLTLLAALNHRMRLLPGIEDVGRPSYGTVAYGAAVTLLLWLYWPDRSAAATAGVLVMALGDGLAGIVGPAVASPRWRVLGQTKSLAGTAAMAAATLLTLLLLRAAVAGGPAVPQLALITLVATALEQLAWLGCDNLTVPVSVGVLWAGLGPGA